jgi:hypothetical protein
VNLAACRKIPQRGVIGKAPSGTPPMAEYLALDGKASAAAAETETETEAGA